MDEIYIKLKDILSTLNYVENDDEQNSEHLFDIKSKLRLYISKYFKERDEFEELLSEININPTNFNEYRQIIYQLKSLTTTLMEDIEISNSDYSISIEQEKQKILADVRKEVEEERRKLKDESEEILKIKNELSREQVRLTAEEEKYNLFKQKLEIADKNINFQTQAKSNYRSAIFWVIITTFLSILILTLILNSTDDYKSFTSILKEVKISLGKDYIENNPMIVKTVMFSFIKYFLTKIMFYSIIIYL